MYKPSSLPLPETVEMTHGAGGKAMQRLIDDLFIVAFRNPVLEQKNDQACLNIPGNRLVFSTDSHVISPLFFPGGDIGSLAVYGTVNDICMSGAKPLYLSASFILEEGFSMTLLKQIAESMGNAARKVGIDIVTGDTKVVEHGKGDGVFINTAGIGILPENLELSIARIQPGDHVILSGSLGDHGVAVLSQRANLSFQTTIQSDSAALNQLVSVMTDAIGNNLHAMRDPTRGGLAATLNEWAQQANVGFALQEASIPVKTEVRAACEILGLDPLNIANEGKLVAIVDSEYSQSLLSAMHTHPLGKDAAIIGEVLEDPDHFVQMETLFGGKRLIDWLTGEQLPRIC